MLGTSGDKELELNYGFSLLLDKNRETYSKETSHEKYKTAYILMLMWFVQFVRSKKFNIYIYIYNIQLYYTIYVYVHFIL